MGRASGGSIEPVHFNDGEELQTKGTLKNVFDLVISSSIPGLDGDGRAGPV